MLRRRVFALKVKVRGGPLEHITIAQLYLKVAFISISPSPIPPIFDYDHLFS